MDISIIIPSFNTNHLLSRCSYCSVFSFFLNIRYEIIVVDNGSADGSVAMVKKDFPEVILIQNKKNVGYGKSNNMGIKIATEFILLLNSDIEVLDQGIESLYSFIRTRKNIFLGGRLLNSDVSPQSSSGPMYTLPVMFAMLFSKEISLG